MKRLGIFGGLALLAVVAFGHNSTAQAQQRQTGNAAIAGLIDVVVQNLAVNVQDSLNNVANENDIRILNLNDSLNGNQVNVLSDILNNSEVLTRNQTTIQNILNNNEIVKNVLNNNNIAIDRVIAVDVLSAPITLIVFNPR